MKLKTIIILALAACMLSASHITPQRDRWQLGQLLPFYGLYNNEITKLHQDAEGYVWIGTDNGLIRFDAINARQIRRPLLTDNHVEAISDTRRYIWVGTRSGLTLIDKQTTRTSAMPQFDGQRIRSIVADTSRHQVWIAAGSNIYRCNDQLETEHTYSPFARQEAHPVRGLYIDRNGTPWALTQRGGLFRHSHPSDKFEKMPKLAQHDSPFTMTQDPSGRYWIGTWGEGTYTLDPDLKTYKKVATPDSICMKLLCDTANNVVWQLAYGHLRALIMRSEESEVGSEKIAIKRAKTELARSLPSESNLSKIASKRAETKQAWSLSSESDLSNTLANEDKQSISHSSLKNFTYFDIILDREHNLMIGTSDALLSLAFHPHATSYPMETMPASPNIIAIGKSAGRIFFSQDRDRLYSYDPAKDQPIATTGFPEVSHIKPSHKRKGVWMAARFQARIAFAADGDISAYTLSSADNSWTRDLCEDAQGNVWTLTDRQLYATRPDARQTLTPDAGAPRFQCIAPDRTKEGIVAIAANGIYKLSLADDAIRCTKSDTLNTSAVCISATIDAQSRLWLITDDGQLRIIPLEKKSEKSKSQELDTRPILRSESPLAIESDEQYVWLMTNRRLIRFDADLQHEVVVTAADHGICTKAFRGHALFVDSTTVIVAGIGGFVEAEKQSAKTTTLPLPRVTDINVDGESLFFGMGSEEWGVRSEKIAIKRAKTELARSLPSESNLSKIAIKRAKTELARKSRVSEQRPSLLGVSRAGAIYTSLPSESNLSNTLVKRGEVQSVSIPSTAKRLEISFSPMTYSPENQPTMEYRLDGYDDEWTSASGTNVATYANLPKGTYRFLVRLRQTDGTWSEPQQLLELKRLPAWWETNIAYLIYTLMAIAAVRIAWLLSRRKIRSEEEYRRKMVNAVIAAPADAEALDPIVQKIEEAVLGHIDDSDYGVEQLAADLSMSRATLHRKVKSATAMTPLEIIRNIKLKRACAMLDQHDGKTISEIAYALGFSNPKYFTKCFKDEFGVTPTEYQQRLKY